jgi:4-amino-4-deoxy-L-arabinose transferase-like glycosyltransferase
MGAVLAVTALGETQTWDEGIHISAGYAYITRGEYQWNVEHPPLVKMMSALPLLGLRPRLRLEGEAWKRGDQIEMGVEFMYKNRVHADRILFAARSMTILLTVLGGLALALWTRRRFGASAALIALALYCFDPNLVAHGRYVTTDVPMAVFYFLTCAVWAEYLVSGRRLHLALAAVTFSLAMLVKFSAVLLIPVIALLLAIRWFQRPAEFSARRVLTAAAVTAAVLVVLVAGVYWRETVRSLRTETVPLAECVDRSTATGRLLSLAGRWFSLPCHSYPYGLSAVALHNQSGHPSYLLGMHSETGWWYYFPVVFAVKSTVTALLATALLLSLGLFRFARAGTRALAARARKAPFAWIAITLPPLFYFITSMTSAINLGVRHLLPVYPLLYVATGAAIAANGRRSVRYAGAVLVFLAALEFGSIYPHYLAFFNFPSGGPGNGPRYLVDSNIDWGQDVKKLAAWLEARGTRRVWINYFGKADMKYYGIDEAALPTPEETQAWSDIDGYAAASVTPLYGVYVPYESLAPLRKQPLIAKVGYSIYVFDMRKRQQ